MRRSALALILLVVMSVSLSVAFVSLSSLAHVNEIPIRADPNHGYIEIWAYENGNWQLIINTSSTQEEWVPPNTKLVVSAKPDYGFQFYGINYSTNFTQNVWNFMSASSMSQLASFIPNLPTSEGVQPAMETTVTAPSEFIAIFPAEVTFSPAYIYDSDYNALWNVSFYGRLVYVANGSPLSSSLAQYLANYLSPLEVTGVGAYNGQTYSNSFKIVYSLSGNYFAVNNQEVANIGLGNYIDGLQSKSAIVSLNSPDPEVIASGVIYNPTNWGWGDTVEFVSKNSIISASWQPFSGVTVSTKINYNSTQIDYYPTGESLTLTDYPSSGLVLSEWKEGIIGIKYGVSSFQQIASSTANPWIVSLPSTPPQPGYVYAFEPSLTVTSATFTIENTVTDVSISGQLTIYFPNGQTYSESFFLDPPNSRPGLNEMQFTIQKIPLGTYTWSISPSNGSAKFFGNTIDYYAGPSSGSFTISSASPTFSQTVIYGTNVKFANVTFTQSAIPSGISWWVDFGGTNESSTTSSIVFYNVPYSSGGTSYSYSVDPQVVYKGWVWKASPSSGSVTVNGNTNVNVNYKTYVTLNISVSPSGSGTANPTQTVIPLGGTVTIRYSPNFGWVYNSTEIQSGIATVGTVTRSTTGGEYYYNIPITAYSPADIVITSRPAHFTVYFTAESLDSSVSSFTYSVDIYEGSQLIKSVSGTSGSNLVITGLQGDVEYTYVFENTTPSNGIEFRPSSLYESGPTLISYSSYSGTFEITADDQNNTLVAGEIYNEYVYVTVSTNGGGTVSPSSGWYQYDSTQQFTATPSSGYYFESWTTNLGVEQGYSTTSNPIAILISAPGYLTANFGENTITFYESGLPNGILWSVAMDGENISAWTPDAITFYAVPTGTYSYSVSPSSPYYYNGNFYVGQTSGSVTVSQGSNSLTISYVKAYPVSLYVSGSGYISWSDYAGTVYPSSGSTTSSTTIYMASGAEVEVTAGQYFSGWSSSGYVVPAQGYSDRDNPAVFTDTGGSGSITASVSSTPTYSHTWTVSNFASGDFATLTVGSSQYILDSYNPSITVSGLSGSVSWSISSTYYNGVPTPQSGTVSGSGTTTITISYSVSGTFSASPTSGNAPLTVSFSGSGSGGSGTYDYSLSFGDGQSWSQSSTSSGFSVSHTYSSAGTFTATLTVTDAYTGATWSKSITISVSNSQFSYTWYESGLPSGTQWGVDVGGQTYYASAGSFISVSGLSGSVSWSVVNPSGWSGHPSSGTISGSGSTTIYFTYSLKFTESGLPGGVGWSVVVNGYTYGGKAPYAITVSGLSGTVSWSANTVVYHSPNGNTYTYSPRPSSGSASGPETISITYYLSGVSSNYYSYTWYESGLPSGTQWGVTVGGTKYTTTGSSITVSNLLGSVSWSVINPSGFSGSPSSGTVSGSGSTTITFTYSHTWTESGLPEYYWQHGLHSVSWSIVVNGQTYSAKAGQSITVSGLFGTVSWSANSVNLPYGTYKPSPSSGTVSGPGTTSISYSDPPTSLNVSTIWQELISFLRFIFEKIASLLQSSVSF